MRDPVGIQTTNLTKKYPGTDFYALKDLNIKVSRGEIYGFLGANGAGKTTAIRLLLNFLQPSSGSAVIMGMDSVDESVDIKKHVGYLAGDIALYRRGTGKELLDYLGTLQGMRSQTYRRTLEQRFQADMSKPIDALSKGNRQKLGILQAFMHQPDVLVLDEPTSGLDPLMQEAFYQTVEEAKDRGAAVFMSSHNLSEAQRVCDRVGIIKDGKLIREQVVSGSSLSAVMFKVRLANPDDMARLKKAPALKFLQQENSHTAHVQPAGSIARALKALGQFDIEGFTSDQIDLESEFIEYYGGDNGTNN